MNKEESEQMLERWPQMESSARAMYSAQPASGHGPAK